MLQNPNVNGGGFPGNGTANSLLACARGGAARRIAFALWMNTPNLLKRYGIKKDFNSADVATSFTQDKTNAGALLGKKSAYNLHDKDRHAKPKAFNEAARAREMTYEQMEEDPARYMSLLAARENESRMVALPPAKGGRGVAAGQLGKVNSSSVLASRPRRYGERRVETFLYSNFHAEKIDKTVRHNHSPAAARPSCS